MAKSKKLDVATDHTRRNEKIMAKVVGIAKTFAEVKNPPIVLRDKFKEMQSTADLLVVAASRDASDVAYTALLRLVHMMRVLLTAGGTDDESEKDDGR